MEFIQKQIEELKELITKQQIQQKEIFTIAEASEYLQLSKSCIYKLTSSKSIPHYSPGGKKIYFKKEELLNWVFESRVVSTVDIENDIESYLSRTNKNLAS